MTIQQIMFAPQFYGSTTTWNPSDKNAGVTLSNGNRTAAMTPGGADIRAAIRATVGKSAGKWYWEVKVDSINILSIGVANTTMPLNDYVGQDANSWGYINGGNKAHAGETAYGASYTTGDIISVALDMDGGSITFYKNGVSQGAAFTGLTGTLYPAGSNSGAGTTSQLTVNFGQSAFSYAVPAGYSTL